MNLLELKMVDILKDLKENHHACGVKAEFETEGTRLEEAQRLKEVVTKAGLDLTVKIGGCEALKDIHDAKIIGTNAIVAPMIESPYAAKKYIQAVKKVFPQDELNNMKFYINIETKYGFNYIDEILTSDFAGDLTGIIFGRSDMTASLGMNKDDVNCNKIFEYATIIAQQTIKHKKEMIIGGGVSIHSLPFFKRLPQGALSKFETRKVIFDAKHALQDSNADKGIQKAFKFELMWIKNKQNFYSTIANEDNQRIKLLESSLIDM